MRSPRLPRLGAALLLSLALHGLIGLGVWLAPYRAPPAASGDIMQAADDGCTLGLDDMPPRLPPKRKPRDPEVVTASFDVKLVEAPAAAPAPPSPAVAAAEGNAAPGGGNTPAATPGKSDGDGGGPCALDAGPSARAVVYVLDRSLSMGFHGALARARREVLAAVRRLPPTARFQVIAYNREAEPLCPDGRSDLLAPDADALRRVGDAVAALRAAGGTDHGRAIRRALALHPDVLFLLTDADDISSEDVRGVTRLNNRRTVIHAVELSGGAPRANGPLHKLAADNGGTYRRVDPEE